ncbi:hypothetical protein ACCO45_007582 [Purpureocillium lilacinum]|uniref:Uncharacterized protein n=1 Tax=Purpureocillium lilacinum TaxID=33203 RepID=A0ACC4DL05_PURLI
MSWTEEQCTVIDMSLPFVSTFPSTSSPSAESNNYTPPQVAALHDFSEMSSVMDPFYLCDTSAALDGGSVNRDFRGPLFSANPSTVAASYPYSQHHKHLQHQQAERVVHQPQLADPTCSSPDEITKTDAGADSCNNMRNARDKSNLPLIKLKRRAQNRAAQQTYRDRRAKHVKDLETKLATLHAAQEDVLVENQRLRQEVRDLSSKIEILGATSTKAKGVAVTVAKAQHYVCLQNPHDAMQLQECIRQSMHHLITRSLGTWRRCGTLRRPPKFRTMVCGFAL